MNKVVDFLEKRIEWIVLALGVLFVFYMAYSYILTKPVMVTGVGPEPLPPGEVDETIERETASKLRASMESTYTGEEVKAPNFVESFLASMRYENDQAKPLEVASVILPATPMITFPGVNQTPGAVATPGAGGVAVDRPNPAGVVAALPTIPAPVIEKGRSGLTNVLLRPAGAAAVAPGEVGGVDKNWISVLYKIDTPAMQQAFASAKIPTANSSTAILRVVLERQERLDNGQWGPIEPVPPLGTVQLQPMPAAAALPAEQAGYVGWAAQHVTDIVRPPFYARVQGDEWTFRDQTGGPTQQVFNPATHAQDTPEQLMQLTPEQRRAVSRYKMEQGRGRANTTARPTPQPRRGRIDPADIPAGADPAPMDAGRRDSGISFQGVVRPLDEGIEPLQPLDGPATPENGAGNMATNNPAQPVIVGDPSGVNTPLPAGEFVPEQWVTTNAKDPNIIGWAHDETVKPGRTYRYRVTYYIKNPVVWLQNIVKNPSLATELTIASPPSEWSEPIDVASTINFWVVNQRANSSISVQVFRFVGGLAKTKTYEVTAGDVIGRNEGNIDFNTGWTMVDLRTDPRTQDPYVLLMDTTGQIRRRDVKADSSDPKFQQLKNSASVATR